MATLKGAVMINQGVQSAAVCLDLNANMACDSGEPSTVSAADGSYTLSYDTAVVTAAQVAAAPFVARVSTAAVDAAKPTVPAVSKEIVLTAPAGKGTQINPLTTVVQAGVTGGLTLAQSQAAVAVQFGVTEGELFDYQAAPALAEPYADNARTAAVFTAQALQDGVKPSVVDLAAPATASERGQIAGLTYTLSDTYSLRLFNTPSTSGGMSVVSDTRSAKTYGTATAAANLYTNAYLTSAGWKTCGTTFLSARGTPSRSNYCDGGVPSLNYVVSSTSVASQNMGTVARNMAAAGSSSLGGDTRYFDAYTFGDGAAWESRKGINLGQPIWVNNINSSNEVFASTTYAGVEDLIAKFGKTTANPNTGSGLLWLGFTQNTNTWLMGAFSGVAAGSVQYYACAINVQATAVTSCTAANVGSYTIQTRNGVKVAVFSGQPDPVASVNYTVGYADYTAGGAARVRITNPTYAATTTASQRLNRTGSEQMLKALGL